LDTLARNITIFQPVKKFSTLKELQQAVGEAIDNALRRGFKRFTLPYARK